MKSTFRRGGALTSLALLGCAAAFVISAVSAPLLAQGAWKQLFNGKDFTGWTVPAGGGRAGTPPPATPPSTNPAERGWTIENGVISSGAPIPGGGRGGGLATVEKVKDFELELDYKLDEAPNTECTPALGEKLNRSGQMAKEQNMSRDDSCRFNSGISFRSGYQLNLGRREAGEYVGVVVHRQVPFAIRGNVAWLSTGDCGAKNDTYLQDCSQFPEIRKKGDWNHIRLTFQGTRLQVWLNGTQITDVTDDPTNPAEASWKEAGPISFQSPGEGGGFPGKVQYRNLRVRTF